MATKGNSWLWLAETSKFFSETTSPNDLLVGTNKVCEVLHRNSLFHIYWWKEGISCFWLVNFCLKFLLKLQIQMICNGIQFVCKVLHRNSFFFLISALEEEQYRRLAKCPHSSLGGYAIVIQYLLIVKLIMVTLLYALFR